MGTLGWPETDEAGAGRRVRPGWQDTLTVAADLALIGIAVTVAALPLLTAGAAVATGSVAARAVMTDRRVSLPVLWRYFRRALLPGLAATLLAAAVALLVLLDVGAVAGGRVPGGLPVLAATGVAAVALLAVGMLTVVRLGRDPSSGSWLSAVRWAGRAVWRQPVAAAVVVGVLTIAAAIGALVPVTAPIVVGYALFAGHVVTDRLIRQP